jgi:hypothetical protein
MIQYSHIFSYLAFYRARIESIGCARGQTKANRGAAVDEKYVINRRAALDESGTRQINLVL